MIKRTMRKQKRRLGAVGNRPLYHSDHDHGLSAAKQEFMAADWHHIVSTVLKGFAILVPYLYINGVAYDQGRMFIFGVNTAFFGQSLEENLMSSFYAFMGFIPRCTEFLQSNGFALLVISLAVATIVSIVAWLDQAGHLTRLKSASKPKPSPLGRAVFYGFTVGYIAFSLPFLPLIFSIVFIGLPLVSYNLGQHAALTELRQQTTNCDALTAEIGKTSCTEAIDPKGNVLKGYVVAKSDKYFALTLNGTTQIIPAEGYHFRTPFDISKRLKEANKMDRKESASGK